MCLIWNYFSALLIHSSFPSLFQHTRKARQANTQHKVQAIWIMDMFQMPSASFFLSYLLIFGLILSNRQLLTTKWASVFHFIFYQTRAISVQSSSESTIYFLCVWIIHAWKINQMLRKFFNVFPFLFDLYY